jgi:hypothetical protein
MVDSESQPFALDPVPPDVREANKRARKASVRRAVSNVRRKKADSGFTRLDVSLSTELVMTLDQYKARNGLKNRSEALEAFLRLHIQQQKGSGAVTT